MGTRKIKLDVASVPGQVVTPMMGIENKSGYCIYVWTLFQGRVPLVTDGDGKYVVFDTELEAQREIADAMLIKLQEFMDGEQDFEDAIEVEEYIVPVTVDAEGIITDEAGNCFGPFAN